MNSARNEGPIRRIRERCSRASLIPLSARMYPSQSGKNENSVTMPNLPQAAAHATAVSRRPGARIFIASDCSGIKRGQGFMQPAGGGMDVRACQCARTVQHCRGETSPNTTCHVLRVWKSAIGMVQGPKQLICLCCDGSIAGCTKYKVLWVAFSEEEPNAIRVHAHHHPSCLCAGDL